jgi:hypothetical protein
VVGCIFKGLDKGCAFVLKKSLEERFEISLPWRRSDENNSRRRRADPRVRNRGRRKRKKARKLRGCKVSDESREKLFFP